MSAAKPVERGNLIRDPKAKRGHCGACDPTPTGRVSAGDLWARCQARARGFVHIGTTVGER